MPKVIKSGVRETVLKVRKFFMMEKLAKAPIISIKKVNDRVAAATGVSYRTIHRIVKEAKLAEASSSKIGKKGKIIKKKRKTRIDKILLDPFDIGVLRRKIHEFYTLKKEVPTVKKLHHVLKEETRFSGSCEILRKYIKKIGFRYRKTRRNKKILVERNDISAWRAHYLQSIKYNDDIDNRSIVYLTYIHSGLVIDGENISKGQRFIIVLSGGERGFVENAFLIFKCQSKKGHYDDMNHKNFKKWVSEILIPNIQEPSLIVMDNALYNNASVNKPPDANSRKCDIIAWLARHNIECSEEYTMPQLLEIVKRNKPEPVYAVDAILERVGHKILRLPPYHADLNPIEMAWAAMKIKVAQVNRSKSSKDIREMVENAFNTISADEWGNYCSHVKKLEEEYRKADAHLDEPFDIELCSDSDDSSECEDDDDSDDSDDDEVVFKKDNDDFEMSLSHTEHDYTEKIYL